MLPINELLQEGRYRVTRQIGQNDVGSVYEGLDNIFEKKILINQCLYSGRKNLSDEDKILRSIKHEAFMHVTDYFAEPKGWFIIMESEEGEFLSELLAKEKRIFEFSEVMRWTEQLLDGLSYLHLHLPSIIYSDIKPQNIFLTSAGRIKMPASAVLKNRISLGSFEKPSASALSYSPLEQIWNGLDAASQKVIADSYDETAERNLRQPVDVRSDIYSLGVLVYQLFTGQLPKNALERSIEILEGSADPLVLPENINADIPPEISQILIKALQLKRENRFDSAVIMRQVLRTAFVRIKERQAAEAENVKPIETAAPVHETFHLTDLTDHKEISKVKTAGQNQETKIFELENIEPERFNAGNTEVENIDLESFGADNENIETPEEISNVSEFEIIDFSLPVIENQAETNLIDETNEALEFTSEPVEKEVLPEEKEVLPEENDVAAESPAEMISENKNSEKSKKIPAELFDFDESDEAEILGISNIAPEPEKAEKAKPKPIQKAVVNEQKPLIAEQETEAVEVINVKDTADVVPEIPKTDYKKEYSTDEFSVLFNEAENKSRSKFSIPVVALILLLLGSGAVGAWLFVSKSDSSAGTQTEVSAPINTVNNPQPESPAQQQPAAETPATPTTENAESQPPSNTAPAEITPETAAETNPVLAQETTPTAKKQTPVKAKPNPSKPQTASAKTSEKQQKKVTVDDLISDY